MPDKKSLTKRVLIFFDKLEDKIRGHLSKWPLVYALVGGVGIVLFWRGVWHTADLFPFLTGPVSTILGAIILLITGAFVSAFIGSRLILTGLKGEKKMADKTLEELEVEEGKIQGVTKDITNALQKIEKDLSEIKKEIK
ncbi:MAG TPA: hypothetical protein VJJ27_01110 [Candidatus Paceibacterota bacterium]